MICGSNNILGRKKSEITSKRESDNKSEEMRSIEAEGEKKKKKDP